MRFVASGLVVLVIGFSLSGIVSAQWDPDIDEPDQSEVDWPVGRADCRLVSVGHAMFADAVEVTWTGPCRDGYAEGDGVAVWTTRDPNGRTETGRYDGALKRGLPHGFGVWDGPYGDLYEGTYVEGLRHGAGKLTLRRGTGIGPNLRDYEQIFEGEFRHNEPAEGEYTTHFADGDSYRGQMRDGELDGYGTYRWADGSRYEGEWRRNYPSGFGSYSTYSGTYTGYWSNGCFQQGNRRAAIRASFADCGFR